MGNSGKSPNSGRSTSLMQTVVPSKPPSALDSLVTAVQGIVAVERFKKKVLDAEIQEISERNKKLEEEIKVKITTLNREIEGVKKYIRENTEKYENMKKDFTELNKKHEEELNALSLDEAHELLFVEKNKKKTIRPGDESQYFIKKEKFRHLKQELHKNYQDDKEHYVKKLEATKKSLDMSENLRLESKKELKIYREEMIMLYCRILKDGKDIRSDGLRWIIKAL